MIHRAVPASRRGSVLPCPGPAVRRFAVCASRLASGGPATGPHASVFLVWVPHASVPAYQRRVLRPARHASEPLCLRAASPPRRPAPVPPGVRRSGRRPEMPPLGPGWTPARPASVPLCVRRSGHRPEIPPLRPALSPARPAALSSVTTCLRRATSLRRHAYVPLGVRRAGGGGPKCHSPAEPRFRQASVLPGSGPKCLRSSATASPRTPASGAVRLRFAARPSRHSSLPPGAVLPGIRADKHPSHRVARPPAIRLARRPSRLTSGLPLLRPVTPSPCETFGPVDRFAPHARASPGPCVQHPTPRRVCWEGRGLPGPSRCHGYTAASWLARPPWGRGAVPVAPSPMS